MKIKSLVTFLFLLISVFSFRVTSAYPQGTPRLGVWITVFSPEKVLFSKANADRFLKNCRESGVDDIYVQVYRADKAYYDSSITDRTPFDAMLKESGEDILKYISRKAKENNIEVHAWLNLLCVAQNRNAVIISKNDKNVLAIDQYGRTSYKKGAKDDLDKYYIREDQLFLEPGDKRVRDHLISIAAEIAVKYPDIKGLHLDYIRYPSVVPFTPGARFTSNGISYGYSETNLAAFKKTTGLDPRTMEGSRKNFSLWDEWRRKQVTSLVRGISERVKAINPKMSISCTVVPSIERTYFMTFQDWTDWLKKGYADKIIAMNYTEDTRLMELLSKAMMAEAPRSKTGIGIGAFLLGKDLNTIKKQLTILKKLKPGTIAIFSYDDIAANPELKDFLSKNFAD